MEHRANSMPVVGPAAGDDVDDTAGGVPEPRLVAAGRHPEFSDGVFVELRSGSAVHLVVVFQSINQEARISSALAQDGTGDITALVGLTADGHSRDQFHQVKSVEPL